MHFSPKQYPLKFLLSLSLSAAVYMYTALLILKNPVQSLGINLRRHLPRRGGGWESAFSIIFASRDSKLDFFLLQALYRFYFFRKNASGGIAMHRNHRLLLSTY